MSHVSVSVGRPARAIAQRRVQLVSTREYRGLAVITALAVLHLLGHLLVAHRAGALWGWLDVAISVAVMVGVYTLVGCVERTTPIEVPTEAFAMFLAGAVGVQTWHTFEHIVTIGDPARGLDHALAELVIAFVTTVAVAAPLVFVTRSRRAHG
ncbi:MAG: hypothetical protein ACRD0A_13250 [Acidimicrobiales bacterium]